MEYTHSGPENLKKARQKKNPWNQINQKIFSWNCIFGSFNDFWQYLKLQKMEFGQKNVFMKLHFGLFFPVQKMIFGHIWNCKKWNLVKNLFVKLIYLISLVFWPGLFKNFWPTVKLKDFWLPPPLRKSLQIYLLFIHNTVHHWVYNGMRHGAPIKRQIYMLNIR